jgi:hypothetical protein
MHAIASSINAIDTIYVVGDRNTAAPATPPAATSLNICTEHFVILW